MVLVLSWSSLLLLLLVVVMADSQGVAAKRRTLQEAAATTTSTSPTECPLVAFLPFSDTAIPRRVAFSHLAAAQLAVEHFNNRSAAAVVPQLVELTANCSDVQISLAHVADSSSNRVPQYLIETASNNNICAIVGPYTNQATSEAGVVAKGLQIPVVSYGADDTRLPRLSSSPFVMSTQTNLHSLGEAAVHFLRLKGRANFLSTLHVSADFGAQMVDAMENAAKETNFTSLSRHKIAPPFTGFEPNRSIRYALREIKKTTYRTIVATIHKLDAFILNVLADAAEEYGLNGNDYMWVFLSPTEVHLESLMQTLAAASSNTNLTKLFHGAGMIRTLDGFTYHGALGLEDPFLSSWRKLDGAFVDRIQGLVPEEARGNVQTAEAGYFQTHLPEPGSAFLYDAVMAAALGKCGEVAAAASVQKEDVTGNNRDENRKSRHKQRRRRIKGQQRRQRRRLQRPPKKKASPPASPYMAAMIGLRFTGATGDVEFNEGRFPRNRNRNRGVTWGAFNIRDNIDQPQDDVGQNYTQWYYLTDILQGGPVSGTWTETSDGPFIFADGSPNPPPLLRDVPSQNYLSDRVQILGLVLMSISIFLSCATAIFVVVYGRSRVIKESQPVFLHLLLGGAVILASSIFTLSFDEGQGWTDEMLDSACIAFPWLLSLGYICIYSALFMKLWRINRLLQAQRRQVKASQVTLPFILLFLATVVLLAVWTAIDPYRWERQEIDTSTGETYGRCQGDHDTWFFGCLVFLMITSTFLTAFMAWKTADVDERLSESSWIFYTIALQCQVLVVGIPVLLILEDESVNATYLGRVLLIFSICMSTVLMVFGPKAIKVLYPRNDLNQRRTSVRGSIGTVRVWGLQNVGVSSTAPAFIAGSSGGPSSAFGGVCVGSGAEEGSTAVGGEKQSNTASLRSLGQDNSSSSNSPVEEKGTAASFDAAALDAEGSAAEDQAPSGPE